MAGEPATTPSKPKAKGGRPTREQATAKALAAIGVPAALINPMNILAAIAADPSAAPTARVMAIRELRQRNPEPPSKGRARSSKKARAQRAAARAGGKGTPWGDDLEPNGRRPQ
jgi:hypothetical protein